MAAVVFLAVAAAVGAAATGRQLSRWNATEAECRRLQVERSLPQVQPSMLAATESALAEVRERLLVERAGWPGLAEGTAPDRLELYARLLAFVDVHRTAAAEAGVGLANAEHFGFARFANEAPAASEIAVVQAQLRCLEEILPILWRAAPRALLAVARENPLPTAAARPGEWSGLPAGRSVRVPGVVDTRIVRLEFSGTTECLRGFLNGLASSPGLVVRAVGVAVPPKEPVRQGGETAAGAVRDFSVTVEAVELLGHPGGDSRAGSAGAGDLQWPQPLAQAADGCFELFAPPDLQFDPQFNRWIRRGAAAPAVENLGCDLPEIRRAVVRWRLVGQVLLSTHRVGLIEDTMSGRTLRLAVGERDPASGLVLRELSQRTTAGGERVAHAVLEGGPGAEPVVLIAGAAETPVLPVEANEARPGTGGPIVRE